MPRSREVENVSVSADVVPKPNASTRPSLSLRRRGFLLGLGATSAGAAALAFKPVTDLVPKEEQVAEKSSGYRATAHVQNYYRTAKV